MAKNIKIPLGMRMLLLLQSLIAIFLSPAVQAMNNVSKSIPSYQDNLVEWRILAKNDHKHYVTSEVYIGNLSLPENTEIPIKIHKEIEKSFITKKLEFFKDIKQGGPVRRRSTIFGNSWLPSIGNNQTYSYNGKDFFREELGFYRASSYYSQPGDHGFFVIGNRIYNAHWLEKKRKSMFWASVQEEDAEYKCPTVSSDFRVVNVHPNEPIVVMSNGSEIEAKRFKKGNFNEDLDIKLLKEKLVKRIDLYSICGNDSTQKYRITFVDFVKGVDKIVITFSLRAAYKKENRVSVYTYDIEDKKLKYKGSMNYPDVSNDPGFNVDITPYQISFNRTKFDNQVANAYIQNRVKSVVKQAAHKLHTFRVKEQYKIGRYSPFLDKFVFAVKRRKDLRGQGVD